MDRILTKLENIKYQCDEVIRMLTQGQKRQPVKGFDEFWKLYPKKDDHDDAEQAWTAVVASPEEAANILFALKHAKWPHEKRYIPAAHRWLRNKKWLTQPRGEDNGKYKGLSESL